MDYERTFFPGKPNHSQTVLTTNVKAEFLNSRLKKASIEDFINENEQG